MTSYSIVWKVKKFLGGCSMRGKVKIGGGRGKSGFFMTAEKYNVFYCPVLLFARLNSRIVV